MFISKFHKAFVAALAVVCVAILAAGGASAYSPPRMDVELALESPLPQSVNEGQAFRLILRLQNRHAPAERVGLSVMADSKADIADAADETKTTENEETPPCNS